MYKYKNYRLYFNVILLFLLLRPMIQSYISSCKTGPNKYDTISETVRLLMSLFRLLLNYKLWQSHFPFNKPDVLPRQLISYRHLEIHEIFHGPRKTGSKLFTPVERARVQELRIVLDSCFLHINTENFIPSRILYLWSTNLSLLLSDYIVKWSNLIPQEFMVDKQANDNFIKR